jgi:hypothetical protein
MASTEPNRTRCRGMARATILGRAGRRHGHVKKGARKSGSARGYRLQSSSTHSDDSSTRRSSGAGCVRSRGGPPSPLKQAAPYLLHPRTTFLIRTPGPSGRRLTPLNERSCGGTKAAGAGYISGDVVTRGRRTLMVEVVEGSRDASHGRRPACPDRGGCWQLRSGLPPGAQGSFPLGRVRSGPHPCEPSSSQRCCISRCPMPCRRL